MSADEPVVFNDSELVETMEYLTDFAVQGLQLIEIKFTEDSITKLTFKDDSERRWVANVDPLYSKHAQDITVTPAE